MPITIHRYRHRKNRAQVHQLVTDSAPAPEIADANAKTRENRRRPTLRRVKQRTE